MDGTCVTKVNCCHMACERKDLKGKLCAGLRFWTFQLPVARSSIADQYANSLNPLVVHSPFLPQRLLQESSQQKELLTPKELNNCWWNTLNKCPIQNLKKRLPKIIDGAGPSDLHLAALSFTEMTMSLLVSEKNSTKLTVTYWLQVIQIVKIFLDSGFPPLNQISPGTLQ